MLSQLSGVYILNLALAVVFVVKYNKVSNQYMTLGEVTWSPVSSSKMLGIHGNHVGNNKNTVSNYFI